MASDEIVIKPSEQESRNLKKMLTRKERLDAKIKQINSGSITVYTPKNFNHDLSDDELQKLVNNAATSKVLQRTYRIFAFIFGALLTTLIITFSNDDFHITKALSILLAGTFISYFAHIYFLVAYTKEAFRVYSVSGVIPNWTSMPVTSRQLIYRWEPIQSISEFSAIGGGIANQMLIVISVMAWMGMLTQFLNNIWFEKLWLSFANQLACSGCQKTNVNIFKGVNGIDAIVEFIGTFGLVIIGIFELDPYSSCLRHGHMTGVYLGFGCPIGFTIQQLFGVLNNGFKEHAFGFTTAILCDIVAVVFAIIWTFVFNVQSDKLAEKYRKNIPKTESEIEIAKKEVRWLTIKNIIAESITLLAGSLALCLYLWHYNNLYPSFKKACGVLPNDGPWKYYYEFILQKYGCSNDVITPQINPDVQYCYNTTTASCN